MIGHAKRESAEVERQIYDRHPGTYTLRTRL